MNHKKFKLYEKKAQRTVYSEEGGSFHDVLIEQQVKTFLPQLNIVKESKILDIGCGPGVFLQVAQKEGYIETTNFQKFKQTQTVIKNRIEF